MIGYETIAHALRRGGVETLFSVPASETMRINVYAEQIGIRHLSARHEQTAVGMADGYFRMTGRAGVVTLGRGPGLTNAANAMLTAVKAHSGVVVIVGSLPTAIAGDPVAQRGHMLSSKTMDQERFLDSLGMTTFTLTSADTLAADVEAALSLAEQRVAVALQLPTDVAAADAGDAPSTLDIGRVLPPPAGPAEADQVSELADLLEESWGVFRRPAIIAGRGAVRSDAREALVSLAEITGAALGTSLLAREYFRGHPQNLGIVGTMSTAAASDYLSKSELIVAVGASMNQYTTLGGELFPRARVIQIDADADALGAKYEADLTIRADGRLAIEQLVKELTMRGVERRAVAGPFDQTAEDPLEDIRDVSANGLLDPRHALVALDRALPQSRTVVGDGGAVISYIGHYLQPPDPQSFIINLDYASMGAGFGLALGAAVARPDRPVVLGTGDGAFMFTGINDLDTAVRYGLKIIILVLDDGGFGQEVHLLTLDNLPSQIADYASLRLDEVARALGARSMRMDSLDQVERIADAAAEDAGPLLVQVPVVRVRPLATELTMRLGHRQHA